MKYQYFSLIFFCFVVSCELFSMLKTSSSLPNLDKQSEGDVVIISPLPKSKSLKDLNNTDLESTSSENFEDLESNVVKYSLINAIKEKAKQITEEDALLIMAAHWKLLGMENQDQISTIPQTLQKQESFNAGLYFAGLNALSQQKFNISPVSAKRIKDELVSPKISTESKQKLKISVENIAKNGNGKNGKNGINSNGIEIVHKNHEQNEESQKNEKNEEV